MNLIAVPTMAAAGIFFEFLYFCVFIGMKSDRPSPICVRPRAKQKAALILMTSF
jgi:hypothetical protein